jgi:hypothetical protein
MPPLAFPAGLGGPAGPAEGQSSGVGVTVAAWPLAQPLRI